MNFLVLAGLSCAVFVLSNGADTGCLNLGGTCQDDSISCAGGYQSGLCSGAANRRCCLPHITSTSLDCTDFGSRRYAATGTGYYPDSSALEGGFVDMHGAPLHTLQQYLSGSAPYVSVAMDNRAGIAYGTPLCIPQLNHKYNRVILFKMTIYDSINGKSCIFERQTIYIVSAKIDVVDTGSAFLGKGYTRIDICTQNNAASLDPTINGPLTLVFQ